MVEQVACVLVPGDRTRVDAPGFFERSAELAFAGHAAAQCRTRVGRSRAKSDSGVQQRRGSCVSAMLRAMCTLAIALRPSPGTVLAATGNRNEFLARPASPPRVWPDVEGVLMPRDDQAGGTWLGLTARGLFVCITNRRGATPERSRRSRGLLVLDILRARDATDVRELIISREVAVWDLLDGLAERRADKALRALRALFGQGESPEALLGRDIAPHDGRDITGPDLFPPDQRDLRCFHHGIGGLDHRDESLGFDHA